VQKNGPATSPARKPARRSAGLRDTGGAVLPDTSKSYGGASQRVNAAVWPAAVCRGSRWCGREARALSLGERSPMVSFVISHASVLDWSQQLLTEVVR
jgi:hypothetical protein